MTRRPFVCGNWKLHHDLQTTENTIQALVAGCDGLDDVELAVAPVAPLLLVAAKARGANQKLGIAAQNGHWAERGAFTGEWSMAHLRELGCGYVIVGHSERRQYFGETDDGVAKKVRAALDTGLVPIACVGESLAERESGETFRVVGNQVAALQAVLEAADLARLVIAYEPVWAIGTGQTATAAQAQEVHAFIRGQLQAAFGDAAQQLRLQYGGSVKPSNASELLSQPDIDGALVGGASLEAESLLAIARAAVAARGA